MKYGNQESDRRNALEVKMGSISPVILALHVKILTVYTGKYGPYRRKTGYRKSIVEGYFHKQPVCKSC